MQRQCAQCNRPFEAQRPQAKYCGATCRVRASRAGGSSSAAKAPPAVAAVEGAADLVSAVTAELTAAGRESSALGVQAIAIAERMARFDTSAGLAALSKELRAVMASALQNAAPVADAVDELKARRDRKRAG
ncbi:hypothetical protein C3472_19955 [Mycobacterium kansasii]|uniref:Uncharacterized protein n=1 Tax=Mycobacterium ostraviense TaxID=2738409 RepID=A0A164B3Q1_9MYCO|nr:hypothetical protein B1T50_04650 [Mycobacterium kansasii]KZS63086.1 hypothetical protein A4G28_04435 [Mycobacterium ostraviense]POY15200.1 hypothetical protein C3472_19780 [Mycobacterium kansasii]POY15233.1 hypothetical protein C3472_19955 [Mycobacterium kansasii]